MITYWTTRASAMFVQIYDYYNKINPAFAKRFYFKIIEGINLITKFPFSAPREQLLEEKRKEFRALLILKRFKVIYYIEQETLYIFDIWDCRQNPMTLINNIR